MLALRAGVARKISNLESAVFPAPYFPHSTPKSPLERVPIRPYPRVLQDLSDYEGTILRADCFIESGRASGSKDKSSGAYHEGVQEVAPTKPGHR